MVDVRNKRCDQEGCNSLNPVFNVAGSSRGRFCAAHKEPGMVDMKSKHCDHEGCDVWPAFNVADTAIVVGVGLLLIDSFVRKEGTPVTN